MRLVASLRFVSQNLVRLVFRIIHMNVTSSFSNFKSISALYNSTNDLEYPQSWNSLSRPDKARIFYTSPIDCCMDHFNETANCHIVDYCSEDKSREIPAALLPRRHSSKPIPKFNEEEPSTAPSNCSQWRPSDEEPGSCTNRHADGWPTSLFRETQIDCCHDFFHSLSCPIVDVCSEEKQRQEAMKMDTFRML